MGRCLPTLPTNWAAAFRCCQRSNKLQTPKSTRSHRVGQGLDPHVGTFSENVTAHERA